MRDLLVEEGDIQIRIVRKVVHIGPESLSFVTVIDKAADIELGANDVVPRLRMEGVMRKSSSTGVVHHDRSHGLRGCSSFEFNGLINFSLRNDLLHMR